MALYAFDGTGKRDEEDPGRDSNVLKFYQTYEEAYPDRGNTYVPGIGSGHFIGVRKWRQVTGSSGQKLVQKGLQALEENLSNGDTDIDVVGFSRGAAEALQFANYVQNREQAGRTGRSIRFLGLWDTVAAFGNPANRRQPNWDLELPENVKSFCHALALDERRQLFPPERQAETNAFAARARNVREVWFRGYHSDVGGGNDNVGLSSFPLVWMLRRAAAAGLEIGPELVEQYRRLGDATTKGKKPRDPDEDAKRVVGENDVVHISVSYIPVDPTKKFQPNNPPEGLRVEGYDGKIAPAGYTMG